MLSVAESAQILQVSSTRVRALIKAGGLPAVKVGRAWCVREEDVLGRLSKRPKRGRPRASGTAAGGFRAENGLGCGTSGGEDLSQGADFSEKAHELYLSCKECFGSFPSSDLVEGARSHEEASFYMAVADFFLQQKQSRLVAEGVY